MTEEIQNQTFLWFSNMCIRLSARAKILFKNLSRRLGSTSSPTELTNQRSGTEFKFKE